MCSEMLNLQLRTKFEIDALFLPVLIHGMAGDGRTFLTGQAITHVPCNK